MKTSTAGRILAALVFASMIGGPTVGTALADDGRYQPPQNRAGYARDRHDNRGGRDNRGWHNNGGRHNDGGWRDSRGWHSYQPVYAPPPVIYHPAPSHGINIFFPFFR